MRAVPLGLMFVTLPDGTRLPYSAGGTGAPRLIVGHGLGSSDPAQKSHEDDVATDIVKRALESRADSGQATYYTARGHGVSTGWEEAAAVAAGDAVNEPPPREKNMFHWASLGRDMLGVADALGIGEFVAIGQSMGAASALYAAIESPERISAIIMIRPPTAWESRRARRAQILADAEAYRRDHPASPHHLVLAGSAGADLPALDAASYAAIKCPVLLLSHGDDDVHPLSTGRALSELMPTSELVVADDLEAARRAWPAAVDDFLRRLR